MHCVEMCWLFCDVILMALFPWMCAVCGVRCAPVCTGQPHIWKQNHSVNKKNNQMVLLNRFRLQVDSLHFETRSNRRKTRCVFIKCCMTLMAAPSIPVCIYVQAQFSASIQICVFTLSLFSNNFMCDIFQIPKGKKWYHQQGMER